MSTPIHPAADMRYPSLAALQAAHNELLRRQRQEGDAPAFRAAVIEMLRAGAATGALLDADDDRRAAQSLLDYWAARLFRLGEEPPDSTLADFDPLLSPTIPDELCPYLGLDAFREDDRAKFFGRRELVAQLVARLADHRLLAVVGPSGSGKSSLVRAGLIPALKAGALPGSQDWRYLTPIVPGSDPLSSLDRVLPDKETARPGDTGPQAPALLISQSPCLLVVDQFEELWTLCDDEAVRQAFIARLLELAAAPDMPHRVVLTMRSDFETYVARAPQVQALFEAGRVQVTPLSAGELREAIERPAEAVGLKLEAGLVELLLQDLLGEPAGLPLLQFTLLKLWENRERNRVTRAAYDRIGGGRLALARSADAFYAGLIPEEQTTARRILLRMVRPGEGLEITSGRVRRAELYQGGEDPGRVDRVLEKLIRERLVRLTEGETPGDTQIEVAHEALVRNWPTLVAWLEEEKVALAVRRRLEGRAAEWVRLGQGTGGLLDEVELREAERWLNSSEAAYLGYDPALPALVAASSAAIEQVERAQAAARERRLARARRFTAVLAALLVVALLAAGVALFQTSAAQEQRNLAQTAQAQAQAQGATADVLRQTAEANAQAIATEAAAAQSARATADNVQAAATVAAAAQAARATADVVEANVRAIATQRLAFAARSQGEGSETGLLLAYEAAARDDNQSTRQSLIDLINRRPRLLHTLDVHENVANSNSDVVNDAEYRPDGLRIVTASNDRGVRTWDAATGAPLKTLNGHTALVNSAAYSPDGRRIVSAAWDGAVIVWDAESGDSLMTLNHNSYVDRATFGVNYVNRAAFDADGTWIATAARDARARLWDAQTGALIRTFVGHGGVLWDVAISPDRRRLATASNDQTARIWDIATGEQLHTLGGHSDRVRSIAYSPDGRRLVTSSDDGTAWIWDAESGDPLVRMVASSGRLWYARFSPDGRRVVTASDDGTARIWDAESRVELAVFGRNSGRIWSATYSPNGQQIITAADQGVAQIWDAVNWGELPLLAGHTRPITSTVYSADRKRVLTVAGDGVRLWDAESGAALPGPPDQLGTTFSAAFSPDGRQAIIAGADGAARIWDITSGQVSATLRGHRAAVRAVAFSPDGSLIATASDDQTARLWDANGAPLAILQGHTASVTGVAFSPDSTRLLTSSADGASRLWSRAGQLLATFKGPALRRIDSTPVAHAAFSPDGSRIVTASSGGTAWLWDTTGQLLGTFQEPSAIAGIAFSERGAHLLFIWTDGTTREFDVATERLLTTLRRPDGALVSAVVSADGRRLMAVLSDNTVRQYLVDTGDLLKLAACRVGRRLTDEEIARFQVPTPLRFDFAKRQCPPALGN